MVIAWELGLGFRCIRNKKKNGVKSLVAYPDLIPPCGFFLPLSFAPRAFVACVLHILGDCLILPIDQQLQETCTSKR